VKNSPEIYHQIFRLRIKHDFFHGKYGPQRWAASVIFKKLPKENSRPIGENFPNLVTLLGSDVSTS
jgi:hypothetical protein